MKILEMHDLCNLLNIGKNTAYKLLNSGDIDAFKIGSVWKIPLDSFNEYISRKSKSHTKKQLYVLNDKIVND